MAEYTTVLIKKSILRKLNNCRKRAEKQNPNYKINNSVVLDCALQLFKDGGYSIE